LPRGFNPQAHQTFYLKSTAQMPQSFTLLFGAKNGDAESLSDELRAQLGITFEPRSSMYLGDYYHYEGPLADKFSVRENFVPGFGLAESDHREYTLLVYAYFFSGTEDERADKFLLMRDNLLAIEGLELIRDASLETDDDEEEDS
jgi:hypothetical protein